MLFNSATFLLFFPTVVAVFFLTPHRFRWILLLAASYYFYMSWEPEYALLILVSTAIDYFAALAMEQTKELFRKRIFLVASLAVNLGILFFFKYFNFFSESVSAFFNSIDIFYTSPSFSLLLPVGISFYTFQSLSYTIDVYRGERSAERHFGIFALYVSFFPQLVAGPIERSTRLLPQFYRHVTFSSQRVVSGLRLMLWGYFLKVVVADNAGLLVNTVYANPDGYGALALMFATVLFSFQIFGDFAGYSCIAIGAARIMGYDLTTNFRRPYLSRSVGEFWRRWHISLMSWFKDYLYIPMGGSRTTLLKWVRNVSIVFLISGLWHGANWTFVAWGVLNALYIICSRLTERVRTALTRFVKLDSIPSAHVALQILLTFTLTNIAWVFFRSSSLGEAWFILKRIVTDFNVALRQILDLSALKDIVLSMGVGDKLQFFGLMIAIVVLISVQLLQEYGDLKERFTRLPLPIRWSAYYAMIAFIVFFGYFGELPFIYFQF